ncbi:MAG TPA: hypothetical protein VFW52_00105 [Candidatus Saccharimonadales bacterium]|nr:hypothetical protein [Candidatus Saccharimonadales bacterium]
MESIRPKKDFAISLELALKNDQLREQYFTERRLRALVGEKVWVADSFKQFEAPEPAAYRFNLLQGANARGYVEGADDAGYFVYAYVKEKLLDNPLIYGPSEDNTIVPYKINTEPIETMGLAQQTLIEYLEETSV